MKTRLRALISFIALLNGVLFFNGYAQESKTLSMLTPTEVISLLDAAPATALSTIDNTVRVDGTDLIGKVYGVESFRENRNQILESALSATSLSPEEDQGAYWLDSDNGYRLEYNGMAPQVMAMARFNNDKVADFGYFFLFPYDNKESKNIATASQIDFCGSLLQDFRNMGLEIGANSLTTDLFDVEAEDNGSIVNARLIDESSEEGTGRYILFLTVEPEAED